MLMVAQAPSATGVELWFGRTGATPPPPHLMVEWSAAGQSEEVLASLNWWACAGDAVSLRVARVSLDGLPPGQRVSVRARSLDGAETTHLPVALRTLPTQLPAPGDAAGAFVVLLASCFYQPNDREGRVGQLVRNLPSELHPHLKVLCGDQVYLDLPLQQLYPNDAAALQLELARKVWRTWSHGAQQGGVGFAGLLALGSTWFVADDHELWNNFPFATAVARSTWTEGGRKRWGSAATALFDGFQRRPGGAGPQGLLALDLGTPGAPGAFSMRAIDGRRYRTRDRAHRAADLQSVCAWLRGLQGPGVLVLSQPIFEEPAGFWAERFKDAGIVDLDDYAELVRALDEAPHDVLLLSGDIHRGRTAECPAGPGRRAIYEVVSSPIAICQGNEFTFDRAYPRHPARAVSGVGARAVGTRVQVARNHVALLRFEQAGNGVAVRVEFWPVPGTAPVAEDTFVLR